MKKKRKAGAAKSWERREKSELDMGLCVAALWFFLLIRLSQAELGRVWAAEQEGKDRCSTSRAYMHSQLDFPQTGCKVDSLSQTLAGSACVNVPAGP